MQDAQYDKETGESEFGLNDRRKVMDVANRILDEMGDNHSLNTMFTPYANIVHKMLTDQDIEQKIREDETGDFEWAEQTEADEAQARLNALRDYNA
jgi:hypothetical protein